MDTGKIIKGRTLDILLGIAAEIGYALFIIFICALISFLISKLVK